MAPSTLTLEAKSCSACNTVKPATDFSVDHRAQDGRESRCKQCRADQARRRRIAQAPTFPTHRFKPGKQTHHVKMAERELAKCGPAYRKAVGSGDTETAELLLSYAPKLAHYITRTRAGDEPDRIWQLTHLGYVYAGTPNE